MYAEPKIMEPSHFEAFFFISHIKDTESMSISGVTSMYHLKYAQQMFVHVLLHVEVTSNVD